MSTRDPRYAFGKVLMLLLALAAALALGRCWGRAEAPVPPPDGPAPAATVSSNTAPMPIVLRLDAGGVRLLPDAAIQLRPMPLLDPRKLYRTEDEPAASGRRAAPPPVDSR